MKRNFSSLCRAALLVAAALLLAAAPTAPSFAAGAPPLVSPQWVKDNLGKPGLVVLDVRSALDGGGEKAYREAHIPGSVHSDYDKAWRVERGGVPFMLPSEPVLERLIGELGIDESTHVVVVPAGVHVTDFGAAARVYWTLKVTGVSDVSILDGGFAAWRAAGLPTESGVQAPSPTIFTVNLDSKLIADLAEVENIAASGAGTLIDARSEDLYQGKEKPPIAKAYGHIPGAVALDSAVFYDAASNRLKPKAELEAIARGLPQGKLVSYCNTGHWAATDWFVLHEVLGRTDVALYDGSIVEWTADASRPVNSARTKWDDLKKMLGLGS